MSKKSKNISPPIGGKKRGRPPGRSRPVTVMLSLGMSLRSVQRMHFVLRNACPALQKLMTQPPGLSLAAAECVMRCTPAKQRQICKRGAKFAKKWASAYRLAYQAERNRLSALNEH